ncbi:unnamed protein product [Candidula unifasciata]|uniref:Nucleoside phosphorylase domain-containing protein n=1 Tax=Candidula unifasciata TaxID=100452 RepID=A0A8S3YSL6_9EUPU|nr:unnamed protein product [Candidula unifasciata]
MASTSHHPVMLPNKHLDHLDSDYLFHLDIPLNDSEIVSKFHNVKFVCIGGTANRMEKLALHLGQEINFQPTGNSRFDYSFTNERYSGFKVGPVFCVSHGIGTPSLSVMLHELFKLLQKASCCDVTLIRIGTCGGIGISPGTVVISTGALTSGFEPFYTTSSLGKTLKLPTSVDMNLVNSLQGCRRDEDGFQVVLGKTYCTEDFYQGQGRLDGSFCDYSKADQDAFLRKLYDLEVRNIEMESAAVLAMAHKVGIRAAVVCSVIVDRLQAELPTESRDNLQAFQNNAIVLVGRHIRQRLNL